MGGRWPGAGSYAYGWVPTPGARIPIGLLIGLLILSVGGPLLWHVLARAVQGRLNRRQLVLADWQGLRITRTELIEGYKRSAQRHPLRGLTAQVEREDKQIAVVVEGPGTSVVKIGAPSKLRSAQEFVTALNRGSHQA